MKSHHSSDNKIAIYVHWPFCLAKCPYCDFNSHVREKIDQAKWHEAYLKEIDYFFSIIGKRKTTSIFFGGGTPSLMPAETTEAIIERINKYWPVNDATEITLEANPTSIEAKKFQDFKLAGINRISVGVQALNDKDLKFLGRKHNAREAMAAIDTARNIFNRFSFDLIYARPSQTLKDWQAELKKAITMANGHLSLYQLTIEKGTPFFSAFKKNEFFLPDEELAAYLYEATDEIMEKAGMPAYEISNYARPGEESRHNLTYWQYGEYVGIGPGAHGRLKIKDSRQATMTIHNPENWLENIEENGHAVQSNEKILGEDLVNELLIMGLRIRGGISRQNFQDVLNKHPEDILNNIPALKKSGFIILDNKSLRVTKKGRIVLGSVISELVG